MRRNRFYLVRTGHGPSALVNKSDAVSMQQRFGGEIREYVNGPLKTVRQGNRAFFVPVLDNSEKH